MNAESEQTSFEKWNLPILKQAWSNTMFLAEKRESKYLRFWVSTAGPCLSNPEEHASGPIWFSYLGPNRRWVKKKLVKVKQTQKAYLLWVELKPYFKRIKAKQLNFASWTPHKPAQTGSWCCR